MFMMNFLDDTPNLTDDAEYNDQHKEELSHTLRPCLLNVHLLEALNRILHDPDVQDSQNQLRTDLSQLKELAIKVVIITFSRSLLV